MHDSLSPRMTRLHADPQVHVDDDMGALADQMRRCAQPVLRHTQFQRRLRARLVFVRHHLVTVLVVGALVAAGVALLR